MKPYVDNLLGPRISKPPTLPISFNQLPQSKKRTTVPAKQVDSHCFIDYSQEYSKGLMAPLCIDLKELPSPETLHSRMTSIALENGLLGGIGEDVVNVMLFAAEVKLPLSNYIQKLILYLELYQIINYKCYYKTTNESMYRRSTQTRRKRGRGYDNTRRTINFIT